MAIPVKKIPSTTRVSFFVKKRINDGNSRGVLGLLFRGDLLILLVRFTDAFAKIRNFPVVKPLLPGCCFFYRCVFFCTFVESYP